MIRTEGEYQLYHKGPYPLGEPTADSTANSIADHPVGMAYLLGNWNRWASGSPQLISSMFDSPLTDRSVTAVALRLAAQRQSNQVGMALKV